MKLTTLKKRLKGFARISNMQSPAYNGDTVANQFIIRFDNGRVFQSYQSIIAVELDSDKGTQTYLTDKWDYSVTTGKYRKIFLGETKKETEEKLKTGEYKLLKDA